MAHPLVHMIDEAFAAGREIETARIAVTSAEPMATIQSKCEGLPMQGLICVHQLVLRGASLDDAISRTKQLAELAKQSPMSFDEVVELALLADRF